MREREQRERDRERERGRQRHREREGEEGSRCLSPMTLKQLLGGRFLVGPSSFLLSG